MTDKSNWHYVVRSAHEKIKEVILEILNDHDFVTGEELRNFIRWDYRGKTNPRWRDNTMINGVLKELVFEGKIRMIKQGRKFPYTVNNMD